MKAKLHQPLFAGSRFDTGRTIWRQFWDDLGLQRGDSRYPDGVWSRSKWYSNTMQLLVRGFELNEERLLPFYGDALHSGKARVIELFEAARRLVPKLDPSTPILDQAFRFGVDPELLAAFPLRSARLNAFTIAKGGSCYAGFGPEDNVVDLDLIPAECMVLFFADEFLAERDRLDELVAIARAL